MDIVWLKKDVRIHDHGPLVTALQDSSGHVCFLYLYEPDQLRVSSVHGSHIAFTNEGLIDLDRRLGKILKLPIDSGPLKTTSDYAFQVITLLHCAAVQALQTLHEDPHVPPIRRILCHEETGHFASFQRDIQVRRWCRQNNIPIREFQQSGVKRRLRKRDDFSKHLKSFLSQPIYPTPDATRSCKKVVTTHALRHFPGHSQHVLLDELTEIPPQHRVDRTGRSQKGGESQALAVLQSFLFHRGKNFSAHISSPLSSWTSCSRLSTYLSYGHLSLRHVHRALQQRQAELRALPVKTPDTSAWLKSLQAFSSRLHWRSHFMQKLESEPRLEHEELCPAYRDLGRKQPGDKDFDAYFVAWAEGKTGFPFLDACMRCLHTHGWINFRMRAMLVSFATYNLWLDWKGPLAGHLGRVFLDYEPGIHYPQLQMQAGTTGINAMRVYSVTKQGKDQDPRGTFIRKHVPELSGVPDKFIHEPWKMPTSTQAASGVSIGVHYPAPIVDEQVSAREGKQRVAAVRKLESTKQQAQRVYQKHGSRSFRSSDRPKGVIVKDKQQPSIQSMLAKSNNLSSGKKAPVVPNETPRAKKRSEPECMVGPSESRKAPRTHLANVKKPEGAERNGQSSIKFLFTNSCLVSRGNKKPDPWSCPKCTFLNHKPYGLACIMCGSVRNAT